MKKRNILLWIIAIMTTANIAAQTWTGTTNADWNTPTNWSTSVVPNSTGNVVIPGAISTYPVLTSNVIINSIIMQPGSQLDVNGFTLSLNGVSATTMFTGATLNNSNVTTDIEINLSTGSSGYYAHFRSNTMNDNIIFNLTGSYDFFEADAAMTANQYNGNATFNINSTLTINISYQSPSLFNGNLTINRAVPGTTNLFGAGAAITGNFVYTNNAGGASVIGVTGFATNIGGTVNITANYISTNVFILRRIINQTAGGNIEVQNSSGFHIERDTLKLNALSITKYRGNQYASLLNNKITGNVVLSDSSIYSGGYYTTIRNNTITGNTSVSINGTNNLYEGDIAGSANNYFGDLVFNCEGGITYIAWIDTLYCNGDLIINRTTGSNNIYAFNAGATITGNFTYNNSFRGNTYFGNLAARTTIGGQINMAVNFFAPYNFYMHRLINQTGGGNISIQNSNGFRLQNDTLLLSSLSITGYRGGDYGYLFNNHITGDVSTGDDFSYSGGYSTVLRNNVLNGNCVFTINGSNHFFDADIAGTGNKYNGNIIFNGAGGGYLYIADADSLICTGNVSINRTTGAFTRAFNHGATINGNLAYNNLTSGNTFFGNTSFRTWIGGRIDINVNYSSPSLFQLMRMINQTAGGSISIQNSSGFHVVNDTLKVTEVNISAYKTGANGYLFYNDITGNVTLADDPGYGGGFTTTLRNNLVTGDCSFTNNGSNHFFDADMIGTGNKYLGNVAYTGAGSGILYLGYADSLYCSGNVSINRTGSGQTVAFLEGATISGNFSYNNLTSGHTSIGGNKRTGIGGMVNIIANYTIPGRFQLSGMINQMAGGNINIQNSQGFYLVKDTLKVNSINITGYKQGQHAEFYFNDLTANVTIADDATFGSGFSTYIRNNVITGNTSYTSNGATDFNESWSSGFGNKYSGNLSITRNAGNVYIGNSDYTEVTGNLTLNSTSGISMGYIKFNGNTDGIIEQLGTQSINIPFFNMEKTGNGKIILNYPVSVSNTAAFAGGRIISALANELVFLSGSTYTGSSDTSYVDGPLTKIGSAAFTFPVGKLGKIAPISISAPGVVTDAFRAQYFKQSPHIAGYDSSLKDPSLHHISNREYWLLDRIAGTSNAFVTLSWDTARSGMVNNLPDLRVARWNGSLWNDEGNGSTTGSNLAGSVRSLNAVTGFSPFTLASTFITNPLPVHFIRFTVKLHNNQSVLLSWKTSGEMNIARFETERSTDGRNWIKLSDVQPRSSHDYEFIDNTVTDGIYFYRVKQVDPDGDYTYSLVNMIKMNRDNKILIWPNPSTTHVFVQTPFVKGSMEIADMSGRILLRLNITSAVTVVPVEQFANGIYTIRITENKNIFTTRFVKN